MVSLNVMLGAAGATGFSFGLARTRWAERRDNRGAASAEPPTATTADEMEPPAVDRPEPA